MTDLPDHAARLASVPGIPDGMLRAALRRTRGGSLLRIPRDTAPAVLIELYPAASANVRSRIAARTGDTAVQRLAATDPNLRVRRALLGNTNLHPDVAAALHETILSAGNPAEIAAAAPHMSHDDQVRAITAVCNARRAPHGFFGSVRSDAIVAARTATPPAPVPVAAFAAALWGEVDRGASLDVWAHADVKVGRALLEHPRARIDRSAAQWMVANGCAATHIAWAAKVTVEAAEILLEHLKATRRTDVAEAFLGGIPRGLHHSGHVQEAAAHWAAAASICPSAVVGLLAFPAPVYATAAGVAALDTASGDLPDDLEVSMSWLMLAAQAGVSDDTWARLTASPAVCRVDSLIDVDLSGVDLSGVPTDRLETLFVFGSRFDPGCVAWKCSPGVAAAMAATVPASVALSDYAHATVVAAAAALVPDRIGTDEAHAAVFLDMLARFGDSHPVPTIVALTEQVGLSASTT